jgi:hypothetical protein
MKGMQIIERNLKKQSQFRKGPNERKYLYERILWWIMHFQAAKNQSQTKPIVLFIARDYNGFFSLKSKLERIQIERVGKWKETI